MFITLTNLGGLKIRFNVDKILCYSTSNVEYPEENADHYITATKVVIIDQIIYVKETPEQIDEILRTSYITVYERK